MLPLTLVYGLAGAGKSALARHVLHNEQASDFYCISDDDRTIHFDSLCIDRDRSNWLDEQWVCFKNGSAFGLSIEKQLLRLAQENTQLLPSSTRQVLVFVSEAGQHLKWLTEKSQELELKIERLVVVLDCLRYWKAHFKNALNDADIELDKMISKAQTIFLNKRDLCSKEIVTSVCARIKSLNERALIEETRFGKASFFSLLRNAEPNARLGRALNA